MLGEFKFILFFGIKVYLATIKEINTNPKSALIVHNDGGFTKRQNLIYYNT